MTDYEQLVKALRCKRDDCEGCDLAFFDKDEGWMCQYVGTAAEAADAIEALQAENPIVESVLLDKMRQQMEENVCHCNVKENAELIAKILDDDVDGKVFELPKRGEWNNHEVACLLAEMFGDDCACNLNGIDEWLPQYCEFAETCCPYPVGVACWEQFLKHRAKMEVQDGE